MIYIKTIIFFDNIWKFFIAVVEWHLKVLEEELKYKSILVILGQTIICEFPIVARIVSDVVETLQTINRQTGHLDVVRLFLSGRWPLQRRGMIKAHHCSQIAQITGRPLLLRAAISAI